MTGAARREIGLSTLVAALAVAAVLLRSRMYRLEATLRARLSPAPPATAHQPRIQGTPVIPMVRYRDVPAAIEWLCRAFGMKAHRIETDASGKPCYAELTIGSGMLMVAPIEDTVFGRLLVQPDEIGGVETQVCYLSIDNVHMHHARARAAGAVVVIDPDHEVNRGRGYSCRDPEGHVWNFGTYDPWGMRPRAEPSGGHAIQGWSLPRPRHALAALVLLFLSGTLLLQVVPQQSARASVVAASTDVAAPTPAVPVHVAPTAALAAAPIAASQQPPAATGNSGTDDGHDAEAHRLALAAAERAASEARTRLSAAHEAIAKAEREARQAEREAATARRQIDQMQRAREAAERAAAEARAHLAAAQQSAERARAEAALERARRIAAGRASIRAARRASLQAAPPQARWTRSWCYTPGIPNPTSDRAGRLSGFCKG
jgi:uncharacterized glyoxalase superfamily protein PhnB